MELRTALSEARKAHYGHAGRSGGGSAPYMGEAGGRDLSRGIRYFGKLTQAVAYRRTLPLHEAIVVVDDVVRGHYVAPAREVPRLVREGLVHAPGRVTQTLPTRATKAFNPNQERGPDGKWVDGGGSSSGHVRGPQRDTGERAHWDRIGKPKAGSSSSGYRAAFARMMAKERAQPGGWDNQASIDEANAEERRLLAEDAAFEAMTNYPDDPGTGRARKVETELHVAFKSVRPEQQIAMAEVYAPNDLDSQREIMLREDVEALGYGMIPTLIRKGSQGIDVFHDELAGRAEIVENFIARKGDPDFPEGSWVMGVRVLDPKLWKAIKSGEMSGFSFQALVRRYPVTVELEEGDEHRGVTKETAGHTHGFLVHFDERNLLLGGTTDIADGHRHEITRSGRTGVTNGHTHLFDIRRKVRVAA